MQCVQGSVAVLGGGSLVHVPEALHGRDVPLDTLLGEVELRHKCQRSTVVATEQHGATVVALKTQTVDVKWLSLLTVCLCMETCKSVFYFLPQLLDCSLKQK